MSTVSFETAKTLHLAGWNKTTFLCFVKTYPKGLNRIVLKRDAKRDPSTIPAPTFEEIYKALPMQINVNAECYSLYMLMGNLFYSNGITKILYTKGEGLPETAAALWFNLKKQNLI